MTPQPPIPQPRIPQPLPGRACDGCNVCCEALTIREDTLRKPQCVLCQHNGAGGLCAIYPDRPRSCRTFECGWRLLRWVKPDLRPDRSGVLVRLVGKQGGFSVAFYVLREEGLDAPGLPASLAAAVAAGVPVILEVPGQPGFTNGMAEVNAVFAEAVAARDEAAVAALIRACWVEGRKGHGRPITV